MPTPRIKMRHLRGFVEITRQGSLKDAAQALNLAAPTLSKTLTELEQILGLTLLHRDRGGVSLTPEGEVFLDHAQMSLAALSRGVSGVLAMRAGASVPLRVGALPSVAGRLLPQAVAQFTRHLPEARLHVHDGPHAVLTQQLRSGALDMVIGRMGAAETMQGLAFQHLYRETVLAVVRPGHPLLAEPSPEDRLEDWPILYPPADAAIRPLVDNFMLARGLSAARHGVETVSGAFGRSYLRQSDAVWLISGGVVAQDLRDGALAALPLDTGLTAGPVGLMTRAESPPTPAEALFRRFLLTAVEGLGLDAL